MLLWFSVDSAEETGAAVAADSAAVAQNALENSAAAAWTRLLLERQLQSAL
ncbi:MAG: hypothetical protein GY696_38235 [Gammaproteobacteria bacterium]|nr:hypothetical protein [Gammaproteobacteria bacterium]